MNLTVLGTGYVGLVTGVCLAEIGNHVLCCDVDERKIALLRSGVPTLHEEGLPGIPTIRVFEALACGIPLVSAPWNDVEGLFTPGEDFLVAPDGAAMRRHLRDVLNDAELARTLAQRGRSTVLARHTCAHRVDELLAIHAELEPASQDLRSVA